MLTVAHITPVVHGPHTQVSRTLWPTTRRPGPGGPMRWPPGAPRGLMDLGPHSSSYHVPFFGYPFLAIGIYNHKVGYPKKGAWYEPTRRNAINIRLPGHLYSYYILGVPYFEVPISPFRGSCIHHRAQYPELPEAVDQGMYLKI